MLRHTLFRSILLSTFLLWAVGGCGFDGIGEPPEHHLDSGVPTEDGSSGAIQPPVVDPVASSVCTDSVPLQGSAKPGAAIIVFGGASAISTDANASSGRFCVDVPLLKGTMNNLQVRAQDPELGMSTAVNVSVMHTTCGTPPPTPEEPKSRNVALGAPGKASTIPDEGNEGFLADGEPGTYVKYSGGTMWYGFDGWVYLKLDKIYAVDKVVVHWRDNSATGSEYGKEYVVLTTATGEPQDPSLTSGYWTQAVTVTNGDGGTDTFELKSKNLLAQYVALFLQHDGNDFDIWDDFAISEIEVWDVPQKTTATTPTTNTCSSISTGS